MKFDAKVLSTKPAFLIPPKREFWFGDPCYVFHGAFESCWTVLLEALMASKWEHKAAHVQVTVDGAPYEIWVAGTRGGDGRFPFSWKVGPKIYAGCAVVNAGTLAILPAAFPAFNRQNDCLYVPFRTGPRATVVDIRQGSWCRGRIPVCIT